MNEWKCVMNPECSPNRRRFADVLVDSRSQRGTQIRRQTHHSFWAKLIAMVVGR